MNNLRVQINFADLIKGKNTQKCSQEESIAQSIMMLITSRYGEVSGNPEYGSAIWELEFSQLVKIYEWEEKVRKSIENGVKKYEKRLTDTTTNVKLTEVGNKITSKQRTEIRRKADITVRGRVLYSDLPFYFSTTVFISPLSQ